MRNSPPPERRIDGTLLIFFLALYLFASPFVSWWAKPENPWWLPFFLWGLLILMLILRHILIHHHDED